MNTIVTSNNRFAASAAASGAALALLVSYCQLLIGNAAIPIERTVGWSLTTLASWIVFGALTWRFRERILRRVEQAAISHLLIAVLMVFGIALAISILSTTVSALAGLCPLWLAAVGRRLVRLAPILLVVAVAVTALVAAYRWRALLFEQVKELAAERAQRDVQWIEFPEAPLLRLRRDDIAVIRTARNYCELTIAGHTMLVRITAKSLEERLAPLGFARVHRSAIVNLARVRVMQPGRYGRLSLLLDDGSRISVSRAYRGEIRRKMVGTAGLSSQAANSDSIDHLAQRSERP